MKIFYRPFYITESNNDYIIILSTINAEFSLKNKKYHKKMANINEIIYVDASRDYCRVDFSDEFYRDIIDYE